MNPGDVESIVVWPDGHWSAVVTGDTNHGDYRGYGAAHLWRELVHYTATDGRLLLRITHGTTPIVRYYRTKHAYADLDIGEPLDTPELVGTLMRWYVTHVLPARVPGMTPKGGN